MAAIGAVAIGQTWNRWLDPIADTGRDLYIPEHLLHGTALYRDILYFYPPMTPWLLALWCAVAGSSLASYTILGITIAATTAGALYAIGCVVAHRWVGFAAAALFMSCSVALLWSYGDNYIFPYAHAAVLAMLFFLAFIGFLGAHLFHGRDPRWLAVALTFALTASWTKVEYAAFTAVIFLTMAVVHRIHSKWVIGYAAAAAASVGIVSWIYRDRDWLRGNVLPDVMLRSPALKTFYRTVGGFDRWPELLQVSLVGAALVAVIVLLLRVSAWPALAAALAIALFLGMTENFFRAWTVLQLIALVVALRRPREPLLLLVAASLCTSSRVFFHLVPAWYGFVSVVPAYALIAYVLLHWLPEHGVYSRRAARVWGAAFAVVCAHWLLDAHQRATQPAAVLETNRGTMLDRNPDRAAVLTELRKSGVHPLVVMPEGLAINYLLGVDTPIAYYTFTPAETADPRAEAAVIRELDAKRPPWIAVVPRDVREFGYRGFGFDYDRQLAIYLRMHYRPAAQWVRPRFKLLLLKRSA